MNITHTINEDRSVLTLRIDEPGRDMLRDARDNDPDWGCCTMETECCERLIANSELNWLSAVDTGDLTDAPILGILDTEENRQRTQIGPHGAVLCGSDTGGAWYVPVLERWGYEPYQLRSFLEDLLEQGKAQFTNHW